MRRFFFVNSSNNTWGQLHESIRMDFKHDLVVRDGLRCNDSHGHGCGMNFKMRKLTIDHVIPISRGGPVMDLNNMQLLCKPCHFRKTKAERFTNKLYRESPRNRLSEIDIDRLEDKLLRRKTTII
jgi:hypothetical protein